MILLVTLLLLIALTMFVGYPLVSSGATHMHGAGKREQLLSARETVLAALKDLEFEHRIGNLSDKDYEVLRSVQRDRAISILSELDSLEAEALAGGMPKGPM